MHCETALHGFQDFFFAPKIKLPFNFVFHKLFEAPRYNALYIMSAVYIFAEYDQIGENT